MNLIFAMRRYYVYRNGVFVRSTLARNEGEAVRKVAATAKQQCGDNWQAFPSGRK